MKTSPTEDEQCLLMNEDDGQFVLVSQLEPSRLVMEELGSLVCGVSETPDERQSV